MNLARHLIEHAALGISAGAIAAGQVGMTLTVSRWQDVQAAHDLIKALGPYGTVIFDPASTFVAQAGQTVNFDTYYVGAEGNYAVIDHSAMANGEAAIRLYGSHVGHDFTGYADRGGNRQFNNFYMYGGNPVTRPYSTDTQNTVVAFRFDSTVTGTSNQCTINAPKIIGAYKAWDVRSASYVVRIKGGRTTRCRYGANMDNDAGILDWAEIFGFEDHLFAENGVHLNDQKGNHWRFDNCHFDYHIDRVWSVRGTHGIFQDCHYEWNTGDTVGDTLCPFQFLGASTSMHLHGGKMAYVDKNAGTYRPFYPAPVEMSDNSHTLIIRDVVPVGLGRRNDTISHDAMVWVSAAGIVTPFVDIEWSQQSASNTTDMPSMTMVQDISAGVIGGCLRDSGNPFNELSWRAAIQGSGSSSAADAGNIGNGAMGSLTATLARVGVYTLTILGGRTNAGNFMVTSPSGSVSYGTVGAAYSLNGLAFTLADGAIDFMAGDKFTITVTGPVLTSVSADENGVVRKNGQSMLKITGQGRVTFAMPMWTGKRRHAWQWFAAQSNATSVFAGSATIRERQNGYGAQFDGATTTFVPDSRGVTYGTSTITLSPQTVNTFTASISGTTMTVTAVGSGSVLEGMAISGAGVTAGTSVGAQLTGAAGSTGTYTVPVSQTVASTTITATAWVARRWKDCTDRLNPRFPMNDATATYVEVLTTSVTAGSIYFSHPAFDKT